MPPTKATKMPRCLAPLWSLVIRFVLWVGDTPLSSSCFPRASLVVPSALQKFCWPNGRFATPVLDYD